MISGASHLALAAVHSVAANLMVELIKANP
jgi:hypothetical protein